MGFLEFCNTYLLGVTVPIALAAVGVFFLFKLRAFAFLHPIRVMRTILQRRSTNGISPMRWYEVLGQTACRDFAADELIELAE